MSKDLNDALFAQLERLEQNGLTGDALADEVKPTIMLAAKVEHATRRARTDMKGEKT